MKNRKLQFKLNKRLAGYSATAMTIAAISTNTDAQVVYSGLKNIVVKNTIDTIDMDGDGFKDFVIQNTWSRGIDWHSATIRGAYSNNQWVVESFSASRVAALDSNKMISYSGGGTSIYFNRSSPIYNLGSATLHSSAIHGYFPGSGDKFIGVEFMISSQIHYGWIRINIPALVDSVLIKDWAYQKQPGLGILTGDTVLPTLSGLSVDKIGMDTAIFNITSNKHCWLQYGVKAASDSVPTAYDILNGADYVVNEGQYVDGGTPYNIIINGLSPNVAYTLYAVAVDGSYDTCAVSSVNFTTIDTILPNLYDLSLDNIGGYTASVFATSDEDGKIYYAVKPAGESAPSAAEIKAGTGFVATGNSQDTSGIAKQFDITGLANATAYKIYLVAENLSGYTSAVNDTSFSTLDVVPPVLSAISVDNILTTSAVAHLTSSEKGTAYYAVKAAADPAPSASEVKAGTGFITSGNDDVEATVSHSFNLTGLSAATAYKVYLTAEDTSENLSSVINASFTTSPVAGVSNIDKNSITINPNPATKVLYITLPEKSDYTIIDVIGQKIQKGKLEAGKSTIDISNLHQGIYYININFNNGKSCIKQIVKK